MKKNRRVVIAGIAAVAALALGTGAGIAASSDDDEPLRGSARERAVAAALDHVVGGTVIETEAGDDGAAYSVEIRLGDGRVVEVNLDQDFHVLAIEADDDGSRSDE